MQTIGHMALSRFFGAVVVAMALFYTAPTVIAQDTSGGPAKPQLAGDGWLKGLDAFDGRAVELSVLAHHIGSQRIFTFGEKEGREIRVLIPNPSVDTANVGDMVTVVGTVRRFDANAFARDYRWFRSEDYPGLPTGALVIVAASVRNQAGADLIPGNRATHAQGAAR